MRKPRLSLQSSFRILSALKGATLIQMSDRIVFQLPAGANANMCRELVNTLHSKLAKEKQEWLKSGHLLEIWKDAARDSVTNVRSYFVCLRFIKVKRERQSEVEFRTPSKGINRPEYCESRPINCLPSEADFENSIRSIREVPSGKADTEMSYRLKQLRKKELKECGATLPPSRFAA